MIGVVLWDAQVLEEVIDRTTEPRTILVAAASVHEERSFLAIVAIGGSTSWSKRVRASIGLLTIRQMHAELYVAHITVDFLTCPNDELVPRSSEVILSILVSSIGMVHHKVPLQPRHMTKIRRIGSAVAHNDNLSTVLAGIPIQIFIQVVLQKQPTTSTNLNDNVVTRIRLIVVAKEDEVARPR